ncbi:MAG: cation:proton antiporter [Sphingomonadaceae bacterium]
MFEVICITFAYAFGMVVKRIGLPPLVGFLAAGFAINALSPSLNLPAETGDIIGHIAHLGVLLLLFTVGLKMRLGQLVQPQVLGGSLIHFLMTTSAFTLGLFLFMDLEWETALLVAIALSFSSTVLSAKTLEARRDLGTFYGRTAIGILIVQDLIALAVLAIWGDQSPTPWALLVFGLPLLRPLLHRLLDLSGHDEMMVLLGMFLALVLGGMGFEAVGLSSEIGALAMGLLLSTHDRAKELSKSLWGLKEVFLVGFFLQIGMSGLPDWSDLAFALAVALVLPVKGALFFLLLTRFRVRARTAFLAAASLTAYSEFGLIVAAGVLEEWLVPLALAVSLSFIFAAVFNNFGAAIYRQFANSLQRFETQAIHRDEAPTDIGDARILILGMGRTGTAAYDALAPLGEPLIGIDSDTYKVQSHIDADRNATYADAEDEGFWRDLNIGKLKAVVIAVNDAAAKEQAVVCLRKKRFEGPIIAHAMWEDEIAKLEQAGATHVWQTMNQAGLGLARDTARSIGLNAP